MPLEVGQYFHIADRKMGGNNSPNQPNKFMAVFRFESGSSQLWLLATTHHLLPIVAPSLAWLRKILPKPMYCCSVILLACCLFLSPEYSEYYDQMSPSSALLFTGSFFDCMLLCQWVTSCWVVRCAWQCLRGFEVRISVTEMFFNV